MRETSGLGEPPSDITARSFLPVRSMIVSAGSRGTGLMRLVSSLAEFLSLINGYVAIGLHSSVSDWFLDDRTLGCDLGSIQLPGQLEVVHTPAW